MEFYKNNTANTEFKTLRDEIAIAALQICFNCKYFQYVGINSQVSTLEDWGQCRRNAPETLYNPSQSLGFTQINYLFPGVPKDSWCGEFVMLEARKEIDNA